MSSADDRKFKKLLHAFELGMLSEEDNDWMEIKILENEKYYNIAKDHKNAMNLLRNDPIVHDKVTSWDTAAFDSLKTDRELKSRNVWLGIGKALVPLTVVLIVIMVLTDWEFIIRPSKEAKASNNRVLILPFSDASRRAEQLGLGQIISSLLTTDLSESQYVQIIPNEYMYDILRRVDLSEGDSIDIKSSLNLAVITNARWIVVGNILQTSPNTIIAAQIIDAVNGQSLASVTISAMPGENVFNLVDRLTSAIKSKLDVSDDARSENDPDVADITTSSLEAYRAYCQGIRNYNRLYYFEATNNFEEAIDLDTTFAMAYYYLALIKDLKYIQQAMQYAENSAHRDRYYIRSKYAFYLGDYETFVSELHSLVKDYPDEKEAYYSLGQYHFDKGEYLLCQGYLDSALSIDPLYGQALNLKAYAFNQMGDFENTILTINKYIAITPDEANPYDTRADLYAMNGELENAIDSYRKAISINPKFYVSLRKLGVMYLYSQKYELADSCFRAALPENPEDTLLNITVLNLFRPWYEGDWKKLKATFEALINFNIEHKRWYKLAPILRLKAIYHYFTEDYQTSSECFVQLLEIYEKHLTHDLDKDRDFYILTLIASGKIEQAQQLLAQLKMDLGEAYSESHKYWLAKGIIEYGLERYASAIGYYERAAKIKTDFPVTFLLGKAYLEVGRFDKAIELFEKETKNYEDSWRVCLVEWNIALHYYLGRAYEGSNWNHKAIEQYKIFLSYKSGARSNSVLVKEAEDRLSRLMENI
jgi:tetratricopeptide (TPR) repeat protein